MCLLKLFNKKEEELGCLGPDPKDVRDRPLTAIQPEIVQLPEEFDLRPKMTSVEKQNWGSCVANATDGVKEFLDKQEYNKEIKLSQKFIYINMKKISGLYNIQGDYIRNGLKSVCQYGACLETTFPDVKRTTWDEYAHEEPSAEAYEEAKKYKGKTYWSVGATLNDFRQAMFQQKAPVVFGMMWDKAYRNIQSGGKLPISSGVATGGHAVVAVGWTKDKLWVKNSWSPLWGNNGYYYIPFNEFTKHTIWSCWILLDVIGSEETTGWCAEKYLKELGPRFNLGDIITPTAKLNLRERPITSSKKITLLKPGQNLEVLEGNVQGGNYKWWKVKVK